MKVCSTENMQIAERELIINGTPARTLMKLASAGIAEAVMQFFPVPGLCIAYVGKGNNGGDALTVLNILKQHGWETGFRAAYPRAEWGELPVRQLAEISPPPQEYQEAPLPRTGKPMILLDGLLGIGAKGLLRKEISALCAEMNYLRDRCGAVRTVAIDLPTGVDPDTGMPQENAVEADFTMCIGAVKQGLLDDDATLHAGRLACIDLPGLYVQALPATELITSSRLTKFLSARPYTDYKNKRGHIGVIAGSEGMLGAARLCCEAALRAGAGLVTLHVHRNVYPLIAPSMPPEIMVKPVDSYADVSIRTFSAFLIGPGIGSVSEEDAEAIRLILETGTPTVLDADGLNLAAAMQWSLGEHILATPHHGEIRRLLPDADNCAIRADIADCFLAEHEAALIYKGARTIVTQQGKPLFYNITGGPGMATAGQGDVLAGVCGGFMAQGESLLVSAVLGTYLCGRASEIAISAGDSTQQTLTAGDTLRHSFHLTSLLLKWPTENSRIFPSNPCRGKSCSAREGTASAMRNCSPSSCGWASREKTCWTCPRT